MKCVRDKQTETILRVQDENALALVNEGTHEFCSKSAWKRTRPSDKEKEAVKSEKKHEKRKKKDKKKSVERKRHPQKIGDYHDTPGDRSKG